MRRYFCPARVGTVDSESRRTGAGKPTHLFHVVRMACIARDVVGVLSPDNQAFLKQEIPKRSVQPVQIISCEAYPITFDPRAEHL